MVYVLLNISFMFDLAQNIVGDIASSTWTCIMVFRSPGRVWPIDPLSKRMQAPKEIVLAIEAHGILLHSLGYQFLHHPDSRCNVCVTWGLLDGALDQSSQGYNQIKDLTIPRCLHTPILLDIRCSGIFHRIVRLLRLPRELNGAISWK